MLFITGKFSKEIDLFLKFGNLFNIIIGEFMFGTFFWGGTGDCKPEYGIELKERIEGTFYIILVFVFVAASSRQLYYHRFSLRGYRLEVKN